MSIELVMPRNHLILCHPLLLLPSIFPSIRVFSNESVLCIRWPKYWSFSFSISPSNEYSEQISFRIDRFALPVVQMTRGSSPVPQFKGINSSALSLLPGPNFTSIHDYWKNQSFDQMDFVGKVMSLFFNMLSTCVIALLPKNKCLLISRLQSLSAVILELKQRKSVTVSPSICHEMMGLNAMILVF